MTFKSVTVPVELNEDRVHALLGRAAEILASEQIPSSRRGCYECERIEGLTEVEPLKKRRNARGIPVDQYVINNIFI